MKLRRFVRISAILAVSTAVTLLAAEGLGRVVLLMRDTPHDSDARREELVKNRSWLASAQGSIDLANQNDGNRSAEAVLAQSTHVQSYNVLSPYVGVEVDTAVRGYARLAAYFGTEEAERNYDVLILGGSVAGMLHRDGGEALLKVLEGDARLAGRPIRTLNQARGGFKAPQTTLLGAYLLTLAWKPDLVILVDGFNEVALGTSNWMDGAHPSYPSVPHWAHLLRDSLEQPTNMNTLVELELTRRESVAMHDKALRYRTYRSALASWGTRKLIARSTARYSAAWRELEGESKLDELPLSIRGPEVPRTIKASMEGIVRGWIEGSVNLNAMCRERGIAFVHALQPTLHYAGSKPATENELRLGKVGTAWMLGVEKGYGRLREAGAELRARGVDFIDATMLFEHRPEDIYVDACHYTVEGSEMLARQIAARLLEKPDLVPVR